MSLKKPRVRNKKISHSQLETVETFALLNIEFPAVSIIVLCLAYETKISDILVYQQIIVIHVHLNACKFEVPLYFHFLFVFFNRF